MLALSALTERIETVREEFLASTIHDVRQPITLIEASLVLASRWVRQAPADVDRLTETLDGALYATQEMSQLIDTLADASRVAMGAVDVDPEPVIVRDVVNDALELLDPASRARIDVGDLPSDAIGDWDRRAVRRILSNLLTNALKYSPPSCRIRVTAGWPATVATIEIDDEGIGLAARGARRPVPALRADGRRAVARAARARPRPVRVARPRGRPRRPDRARVRRPRSGRPGQARAPAVGRAGVRLGATRRA